MGMPGSEGGDRPGAASSPTGEPHPGQIIFTGPSPNDPPRLELASDVPQSIGWVALRTRTDGAGVDFEDLFSPNRGVHYVPVVRIEATTDGHRTCILKYGPDGQLLESTTGFH